MTRSEFFTSILGAATVPNVKTLDLGAAEGGKRLFAIQVEGIISDDRRHCILRDLQPYTDEFNCKFLLLDGRAEIVRLA